MIRVIRGPSVLAAKWLKTVESITTIGYSLSSLNKPRFTKLIRKAADSCRCVAVIEPGETIFKQWEVFAATHLPRAKSVFEN